MEPNGRSVATGVLDDGAYSDEILALAEEMRSAEALYDYVVAKRAWASEHGKGTLADFLTEAVRHVEARLIEAEECAARRTDRALR